MKDIVFTQKFDALPDLFKKEVLDFMDFLLEKDKKNRTPRKKPIFGSGKGMFKMAPDFDEPLDDFNEYMY